MGQGKSLPFGLDNALLVELSVVMENLRKSPGNNVQCMKRVQQVQKRLDQETTDADIEYIRDLINASEGASKEEVCRKLMENYALRLEVIEKVEQTIKYAKRRFDALMTGPQCVNESPYVTEDMDVPSADLTEQECNGAKDEQMNRNYMWKQVIEPPIKDDPVNQPWYDLINESYTDINKELEKIRDTLSESIDEKTLDAISKYTDIIRANAENAYIGAIKFVYSQYKAAREERAMKIASDPVTQQSGGGKNKMKGTKSNNHDVTVGVRRNRGARRRPGAGAKQGKGSRK
jgi:hypothetical protein